MRIAAKLLLSAAILLIPVNAFSQSSSKAEIAAARNVLEEYLKALEDGSKERARRVFHSEGIMTSVEGGKYAATTFAAFVEDLEKPSPDEAAKAKFWVESVEVVGTVAFGKTVLDVPGVRFTDHMTLLKIGDEWKIVNKSFYGGKITNSVRNGTEVEAARVPLENYLAGLRSGDQALLRKAFHPEGKTTYAANGKFISTTFEKFITATEKPSPDEAKAKLRIENIEVIGTAAFGRVVLDLPAVKFTDYLTLLKINGEWKIVFKGCHGEQKQKKKPVTK